MSKTTNGTKLPNMAEVFKNHPRPEILHGLLSSSRTKAIEHLQETIPSKIQHIQALIASESDPTSPFWTGHPDQPYFTQPKLYQPNDPSIPAETKDLIVHPSQVSRSGGTAAALDDGAVDMADGVEALQDKEGISKGVRPGVHWFEVVPKNEVQSKMIELSVKEHEDLHTITQDLRVWLELEIPLIEDGNSFGAEVQNSLIRELNENYKRSNAFQNGCRSHHGDRLRLAQEWAKYPNLMDYPAAIAASDRFDHNLLRSYLRSLLLVYGGLLTKFERNWSKVINPKSSQSIGGMY